MNHRILAVALAVASCGPEEKTGPSAEARRYSTALCAALADCGCAQRYASVASCEQIVADRFDSARIDGLDLEANCLDKLVDSPGLLGCDTLDGLAAEDLCVVLQGDKEAGEACSPRADLVLASDCAPGLACPMSICVGDGQQGVPPTEKSPGASCSPDVPVACGFGDVYCGVDGTCYEKAALGEPCDHPWGCDDADEVLYCQGAWTGDGICAQPLALGAACDPVDWFACDGEYCDPGQRVCVPEENQPAACELTNYPLAWPWPSPPPT